MKQFILRHWPWLLPLFAFIAITPWTPKWDLAIASHYYHGDGKFSHSSINHFIYEYGIVPAQLTVCIACIAFLLSYCFSKCKRWRQGALMLILPLLIGSGFIVHAVFKDHWGRARPKQVVEFGGNEAFTPYYAPNLTVKSEPAKSFPCGHCTMGFYFFALALLGRQLKMPVVFWGGLILALGLGTALSLARIQQGGHFLSDTLASALIMWLSAYACCLFLLSEDEQRT